MHFICMYVANKSMKFSICCVMKRPLTVLLTNCRDKSNIMCCYQWLVFLSCLKKSIIMILPFFFISNRYFVFCNKIYQICDLLVCLHDLSCLPERIKIRHLNFCYSNIIQRAPWIIYILWSRKHAFIISY